MKIVAFLLAFLFLLPGLTLARLEGQEVRIFKVYYRLAGDVYPALSELKSPDGKISVDANTNTLIVVDYPANLESMAAVIRELDKEEKQVAISVIIADVTGELIREIGLASGQVVLPEGNLESVIGLIKANKDSAVRSEMVVTAMSGRPARIGVTVDEIYGYALTGRRDGELTLEPLRQQTGEMLEVLPTVSENGKILVTLRPSSSMIGKDKNPREKTILTRVLINNGDTLAIGGFDSAGHESISASPAYGKKSKGHASVVMFLTARITG